MRRIIGEKISELCVELCQRIGDVYEGPYMTSIKQGKTVLTFYGQNGAYTAFPTPDGLSIKDERGIDIAHYSDIADITF